MESVLLATLSPDATTRVSAELKLSELGSQPGTGLELARIATDARQDLTLRQSASFALKKFVKEHWSPFFPTFKGGNAASTHEKEQIRQLIFAGLADPVRKIRLACAVVVSDIAHPDWPDDWPSLMDQLLTLIQGTPDAVDGGMRVLNDFVGVDLSEDQLLPVARQMLPQLLNILAAPQTYSASARARAVLTFRQCVMTLYTVKSEYPAAVKSAVSEILPQWLEAMQQLLAVDLNAELSSESWDSLALRIAIFRTIEVGLNSFPSAFKSSLAHFVETAVAHLETCSRAYTAAYLSSTSDFVLPTSQEEDSDVSSDLSSLVNTVIDFLAQAVRRKSIASMFNDHGRSTALLRAVVDSVFQYAHVTSEEEDSWATDPNAYVADEDDEMIATSVRNAALDLALALVETFPSVAFGVFWQAFGSTASGCDAARQQQDEDWWKGYEAALAIVGAISSDLLDHVRSDSGKQPQFNLEQIFTSVVPAFLVSTDTPFLQGRSFVFASQFSSVLPTDIAMQYLDSAIKVLDQSSGGVPVKLSAVRALNNFFRHLKATVAPDRAAETISRLLPLLPQTTDNTQTLIIDTIESAIKIAGQLMNDKQAKTLVSTALSVWFSRPEDPMLSASVGELLAAFSAIDSAVVAENLLKETLPALSETMMEIRGDPMSIRASSAVTIVDSIFDGRPAPLAPGMFATVAESLFAVLSITDDRDMQQTGLHTITTVVRKDVDQLLTWQSQSGQSGLELVLNQVARLLEPSEAEAGGLFVGDLVMHLIRKAGDAIAPVLPDLLRAFVTRLNTAETATFSQSLILPFAYLIHTQSETVLTLLESITVAGGSKRALDVLLVHWCDTVDVFQGFWNLKVSTVALSQLLLSQRDTLQQVSVKGELILNEANRNRIMTRARAKQNPDQFTQIPFLAKALKLLVHDYRNALEEEAKLVGNAASGGNRGSNGLGGAAEDDDGNAEWADEDDEEDEEDDDDGGLVNDRELAYLSDLLGTGGRGFMDDDDDELGVDEDEEDLKDDPVFNLDLRQHLSHVFKVAFDQDLNHVRQIAEHYLTEKEKATVSDMLKA